MRIVAISDQHGNLPDVPPGDLLIVAGDVCPDRVGSSWAMHDPARQKSWFDREARPWLAKAPVTHKFLTWGNHDFCGQACSFRRDAPAQASTTDVQILVDEGTTVPTSDGTITIWATPWSNEFMTWAFMQAPAALAAVYAAIPEGVDILVSHQPPFGCGDYDVRIASESAPHIGSRELLAAIARIRPRLVICGHIHEGHGCSEWQGIPIYNVSVVDEQYRMVHRPTMIDLPARVSPER